MRRNHIALVVGLITFMLSTALAILIPVSVRHDMDTLGWSTFGMIIALGYFSSGLMLYVFSQSVPKKSAKGHSLTTRI